MILREFIRHTLTEAMKGPDDLPDGWYVKVKAMGDFVAVQLYGPKKTSGGWDEDSFEIHGEVGFAKEDEHIKRYSPCSDAWIISATRALKGWGPLLYDVAIEWASMHGSGLAPDRESVSDDAYRVWDYYMRRRPDVKSFQLDSKKNVLTPDRSDNCAQISTATQLNGKFEKDLTADELKGSPLARRYTKAPTQINALKKLGKLRVEE